MLKGYTLNVEDHKEDDVDDAFPGPSGQQIMENGGDFDDEPSIDGDYNTNDVVSDSDEELDDDYYNTRTWSYWFSWFMGWAFCTCLQTSLLPMQAQKTFLI